jgi:hypothetical protein
VTPNGQAFVGAEHLCRVGPRPAVSRSRQFVRREHVDAAGTVKCRNKQHSAHPGLVHVVVVMQAEGGLTVILRWSTVQ